jgi:3-oxoacyl-[acyl-carrier protein] reductase
MFDLTGKVALVTGASGGLGSAIAKAFYDQGAHVILTGTREPVLAAMQAKMPDRSSYVTANLAQSADADGLIAKAEAVAGPIDVLVANAGITRDNLLLRMKDEEWDTVIKLNLDSYFRLSRSALKGMMKRRFGRIIGITSIVGVTGNPGQANYAASKAGMIGFSKALAQEVASRNITVNCVAPGFIASAMTDVLNDQQRDKILNKIPAGRLGQGSDIACACVYLASDEASYITGQTLHINGGMAMI